MITLFNMVTLFNMGISTNDMHLLTFLFAFSNLVFFSYQIICYILRPSDRYRLYYLILLYLLTQYDVLSVFLPDPKINIAVPLQNIIEFAATLLVSAYLPYYFYKAFELTRLKFFASWGVVIFLILPYLMFFLIPYYLTEDLQTYRKAAVVVSCMYAVCFAYFFTMAIKEKSRQPRNSAYKIEITGICVGVFFWVCSLLVSFFQQDINGFLYPIVQLKNGSEVVSLLSTNLALLAMTILFIRHREEYQFLHAQMLLEEVNADLNGIVEKRTQEKTTFINLAHETKTPLTLINNSLEEYIAKYGEPEELRIIKYSLETMTKNVVNFFDLERIEKGFDLYDHTQIADFSDILSGNIILFKEYAKKRNIEIVDSVETGVLILADPGAVNRIINNLIENAIKFSTQCGRIEVTLRRDEGRIRFSVKDNGIGIHPSEHCRIFDPYYQIRTEKKNLQGMGLGLAVVKKIVDSLQAKIQVFSNPDLQLGTGFHIDFMIPVLEEEPEISPFKTRNKLYLEVETPIAEDETFDESKPYILVVEDSIPLLNWITRKLKENYNVYVAGSGRQALEKLKTIKQLDLIISDIVMDEIDGYEFLQNLSDQKKFLHIPFVFVTARTNIKDKTEGLGLGAVGYVYKPFDLKELTNKVASIVKIMEHQRNAIFKNVIHHSAQKETEIKKERFENNCSKFSLTVREAEVVQLVWKRNTYKEIAASLFISENTVRTHIKNIFEKTGAISKGSLLNILEA